MLVAVLDAICRTPPVRRLLRAPAIEDRRDPDAFLLRRLPAAGTLLEGLRPHVELAGREVADIGSGLGDKSAAAAALGAGDVVGIDLDPEKLQRARLLTRRAGVSGVHFALGSASRLPLGDRSRDVVLLLETIEHVDEPAAVLAECRRVLRPGGRIAVAFPPYLSPWGGHLFQHVSIPWAHLLPRERAVLDLWRRHHRDSERRTGAWVTPRQARRISQASSVSELWSLNGMTVARFVTLAAASGFVVVRLELKTAGLIRPLLRSPRLREYLITHVTAIME